MSEVTWEVVWGTTIWLRVEVDNVWLQCRKCGFPIGEHGASLSIDIEAKPMGRWDHIHRVRLIVDSLRCNRTEWTLHEGERLGETSATY